MMVQIIFIMILHMILIIQKLMTNMQVLFLYTKKGYHNCL